MNTGSVEGGTGWYSVVLGQNRAVLVASMMSFQKIYGLHGLNHQIIEYSKKEKVMTDKQTHRQTHRQTERTLSYDIKMRMTLLRMRMSSVRVSNQTTNGFFPSHGPSRGPFTTHIRLNLNPFIILKYIVYNSNAQNHRLNSTLLAFSFIISLCMLYYILHAV